MKSTDPEIYPYYLVILAIYRRYSHLLQTSLAAEFLEGFDNYTTEDLFGNNWHRHDTIFYHDTILHPGNADSFAAQLAQQTISEGDIDSQITCLAYDLIWLLWCDLKGFGENKDFVYQEMLKTVRLQEDPKEAEHWLHVIMDEKGLSIPPPRNWNP